MDYSLLLNISNELTSNNPYSAFSVLCFDGTQVSSASCPTSHQPYHVIVTRTHVDMDTCGR